MSEADDASRIDESDALEIECQRLEILLALERARTEEIENSHCWRVVASVRRLLDALKRRLKGCSGLWRRRRSQTLSELMENPLTERRKDSNVCPSVGPKVSILVPLYNTNLDFLQKTLASVGVQTYANWELCLADASDLARTDIEKLVGDVAARDARIKYVRLKTNGGISANTNGALALATGDVVALLDHDDLLHPQALEVVVRAFTDQSADFVYTDEATFDSVSGQILRKALKPDFDPDYLRGMNYICHFTAFRRSLLDVVGVFDSAFDGSQDHDLFLRLTERAKRIVHVPKVVYFWRAEPGSVAASVTAKPYAVKAGRAAVAASLARCGLKGTVESVNQDHPTWYRVRYEVSTPAHITVIIPTRNHCSDLKRCLDSIFTKSTYRDYDILIVDNGSDEKALLSYYEVIRERPDVKVIHYDAPFNYSKINNFAVEHARGDYILFLNNDTEVIASDWLEEMLMFAQRPDVGAVGARLLYPGGAVQHGGVILGLGGVAGHAFLNRSRKDSGYMGRLTVPVEYSAVTAACLMMRKAVFEQVGGLCPELAVVYNDVDLCLKVRKAGLKIIWTPFAELYHHESKSRGSDLVGEKRIRAAQERHLFQRRWAFELAAGDPFYHPHFLLRQPTFVEKHV